MTVKSIIPSLPPVQLTLVWVVVIDGFALTVTVVVKFVEQPFKVAVTTYWVVAKTLDVTDGPLVVFKPEDGLQL